MVSAQGISIVEQLRKKHKPDLGGAVAHRVFTEVCEVAQRIHIWCAGARDAVASGFAKLQGQALLCDVVGLTEQRRQWIAKESVVAVLCGTCSKNASAR